MTVPIPVIPAGSTCVNVSDYGRSLLTRHGISFLAGLNLGISALGHARRWLENRGQVGPALAATAAPVLASSAAGPWSEARARRLLADAGVPVVPGGLAGSAEEAVEIARRVGLPVALKVCSTHITHKSDIGGVALGLGSETEVRAVGLGGIWVEILGDTSLRVLPVDAAEVRRMLGELRGLPLLRGARGRQPANLDVVAEGIVGLGEVALSLNGAQYGALRALEVNPLWVNGDQVEALDVLVVTEGTEQPT